MKPTYFIVALAFIAIVVAGLVIWSDKQSDTKLAVDTNMATATSTASTVPSPLTLASLQALPDWNPTMEVVGMKRIEDGNPDLAVKGYATHTEELSWTGGDSSSSFVIKYLEPEVSVKACEKYGLSTPHPYYGEYNCLIVTPDLFNEVIITSKDTGEVLHKYRLKEGYSLSRSLYQSEGGILTIGGSSVDRHAYIYIYRWDFSSSIPKETSIYYNYRINLLNGEIETIPHI